MSNEQIISLIGLGREIDPKAKKNLEALDKATGKNLIGDLFVEVAKGCQNQTAIERNGQACYVIYWYRSITGGLNLTCAVSVDRKNDIEILVRGAEMLARQQEAKFICFHTRRLGLVKQAEKFGYCLSNVELVKIL